MFSNATSVRRVSLAGILLLCVAAWGCGGDGAQEQAGEFGLYVPGDTPVVHAATDPETPRSAIALTSSELFGLGPGLAGNPNQFQIAVGSDGRVLQLDVINGVVRGIGPTGTPLEFGVSRSLEIRPAPLALGTAGDSLLLGNVYPGRLRVVAASGEIVSDIEMEGSPWRLAGLPDGTFIALQMETGVLGRYSREGQEIARYTVFQMPEEELGGEANLWPQHDFAVGRSRVYVTTAESHQVNAFAVDGGSVWSLEGDKERAPIPEHITGRTMGRSRRAGRAAGGTIDTEFGQVKWPEFYPALARIATDAQDRLYVFPYVTEENPDRYPVDVYEPNGTLITHGWLPFQGWDAFAEDAVYRIEVRDERAVVVRYELDLQPASRGTSAAQ